jgi:hypothetical protein
VTRDRFFAADGAIPHDIPQPYKDYNNLLLTLSDWREPVTESAKLGSLLTHLKAKRRDDLAATVTTLWQEYKTQRS